MNVNRGGDVAGDGLGTQVRLLAIGAVIGGVLLGASLVIGLGGFNDPQPPKLPTFGPGRPSLPTFPSNLPSMPPLPTGLPTRFPTGLPSLPPLPTDLPGAPALPGGGQ